MKSAVDTFPASSVTPPEASASKFSPSVPSPATEFTVTVTVVPLAAETLAIVPDVPLVASTKSPVSISVTFASNVTVNWTLSAFVGSLSVKPIDCTVGTVVS